MDKGFASSLRRFARDERGNVFIIVGLAIIILVGVVGVALDMGTGGMIKTRMQNASDAAALAGAIEPDGTPNGTRENTARRFFALNYPDNYAGTDLKASDVSITANEKNVLVDTNERRRDADVVQVLGINEIKTRATTEVANIGSANTGPYDVTLVMDASGSMGEAVTGGYGGTPRLALAKNAAKILVDQLLCDAAPGNRIGWVDYSTEDTTSSCSTPDNCVPVINSVALSGSCAQVSSTLNNYRTGQFTNAGDGLERAEQVIATGRPNAIRAVVYLTDGLNNVYQSHHYCWGDARSQCRLGVGSPLADAPALAACQRLKDRGILVYGIAFSQDAQSADVVRNCSSGPDYYFYAPDAVALQDAFKQIVTSIKSIRITR